MRPPVAFPPDADMRGSVAVAGTAAAILPIRGVDHRTGYHTGGGTNPISFIATACATIVTSQNRLSATIRRGGAA
ncbi:hypothetical protein ACVWYO_000264 [Sphingomonas sp. UYP23]